jgi:hypothetical protein
MFVFTKQQSGQWLIQAIHGHQMRKETKLKAMTQRPSRSRTKCPMKGTEEMLQRIKGLNTRFSTEIWRVLDAQLEPKEQRLL